MEIMTILSEVKDPRRDHRKEHSLEAIFYIAIAAVIGGAESWYEIEEFGKMKEEFFKSRIKDFKGVPSHDTFNRVFSILNPDELERGFRSWIDEICGKYKGIVAIDGKEICGARETKADGTSEPLRMVSAWAVANGVVLGQEKVGEKTNEIKAIPELLKALDLVGCVITIDAIGCQHDIVKTIVDNGADFVICVKENQKKLYRELVSWFDSIDEKEAIRHSPLPEARYQTYMAEEEGHGRREKRICKVYSTPVVGRVLGWEKVNSVIRLTRKKEYKKDGRITEEKHYYISSLPMDSEKIMKVIRSHWGVENNLHWQLDVTFDEDDTRKRGNAARNFSLLCKIAMTQIKNSKRKGSFKMKRKMAGWDDKFLTELLDADWLPQKTQSKK